MEKHHMKKVSPLKAMSLADLKALHDIQNLFASYGLITNSEKRRLLHNAVTIEIMERLADLYYYYDI